MVAELTALRDQIDEVDKALLNLLAKRLELVAEVGEVKSRFGLPIYVPEREASMLASRRAEAEALGVPPDLIEDVLRRVMHESYSSEKQQHARLLTNQIIERHRFPRCLFHLCRFMCFYHDDITGERA
ncbi:chorismate mutase, partial [Escherichia coli]|uniref:chorismate mutase n=1 Tax=Escherichia coli TaxID=562 RepID=UPI003EE41D77